MARYLVVADQTVTSPDLIARAAELSRDEPGSTFTLLLPALLPSHIPGGPFEAVTRGRAEQAKRLFAAAGVDVTRTAVGDAAPLRAIEDELEERADAYDAIIFCTLPHARRGDWLRLNDQGKGADRFGLPLIHVQSRTSMQLEFRPATIDDHELIQGLWDESRLDTLDEHGWGTLITSPGSIVLVAEEEGSLVGTIVATFDGWRAYVYHVAVVPGRRRRGVAKALIDEAHAHLAREGNGIVYVMVDEENEGGIALLSSLGYREQDDIVMITDLGDASDAE